MPEAKWTRELILDTARKCTDRRKFHQSGARRAAKRLGCWHEALASIPNRKYRPAWTAETARKALDEFGNKAEAWLHEKALCMAAKRLGVWDDYWSKRS